MDDINIDISIDFKNGFTYISAFIHRYNKCTYYSNISAASYARLVRLQIKLLGKQR